MTDMETTRTASPAEALVVVEGDSPADIARARDAARAFLDSPAPVSAPETARTLALVVSEFTTKALRHGGGRSNWGHRRRGESRRRRPQPRAPA